MFLEAKKKQKTVEEGGGEADEEAEEAAAGDVRIRVLASSDKAVVVGPLMRALFSESGEFPNSFPYRQKAIFAFQQIDGHDVCFFGMYVQEDGLDCPQPNHRQLQIS